MADAAFVGSRLSPTMAMVENSRRIRSAVSITTVSHGAVCGKRQADAQISFSEPPGGPYGEAVRAKTLWRARWAFLLCLAFPAHALAARRFKVAVRIASESSQAFVEPVRGQTSDLELDLSERETAPLEPSLAAQI